MLEPGRATFEGEYAQVRGAINVPKGLQQPRIPIIVGGNGRSVTAGYAIRYADELNYVFLAARRDRRADADVRRAARRRAAIRPRSASRCTPATRRSASRARRGSTSSAALAEIGLDRIVCFPTRWSPTPEAQAPFAEDCLAAGLSSRGRASGRERPG